MTCKYYINNQCDLILEWQPDRFISERFCQDICQGRFGGDTDKLIVWAKEKQNGRATPQETYRRECQRICNECEPKEYCQFKDKIKCKRGLPQYVGLCPEKKWPEIDSSPQAGPGKRLGQPPAVPYARRRPIPTELPGSGAV